MKPYLGKFNRFTKKGSFIWNITHNTERTSVSNLNPDLWGSPLVQRSTRNEIALKRDNNIDNIIIIIIIIIIVVIIIVIIIIIIVMHY